MSFLFRKRIKILPGVWFNLSKGGVSTSFGVKGLTLNIMDDKVKTTASLPGTGLSYRTTSTSTQGDQAPTRAVKPAWVWLLVVVIIVLVFILK
jgi:Protein of unknown function (DUF4236)